MLGLRLKADQCSAHEQTCIKTDGEGLSALSLYSFELHTVSDPIMEAPAMNRSALCVAVCDCVCVSKAFRNTEVESAAGAASGSKGRYHVVQMPGLFFVHG